MSRGSGSACAPRRGSHGLLLYREEKTSQAFLCVRLPEWVSLRRPTPHAGMSAGSWCFRQQHVLLGPCQKSSSGLLWLSSIKVWSSLWS